MDKLISYLNNCVDKFKEIADNSDNLFVRIITHYDTDGITSGAIMAKTLYRADIKFHITIVSQLEKKILEELADEFQNSDRGIIFLLDLAGDFDLIKKINAKIFILDHHETESSLSLPINIFFINPLFFDNSGKDEISGSSLTYLFSKRFNEHNKDLASLAVIGMVGDVMGQDISKINNLILQDSSVEIKKGISIISSTKPLNKALEFSTEMFIPGVTGDYMGAVEILREAGIKSENGKNMLNLSKEELSKLVTAIILRIMKSKDSQKDLDKSREASENLLGNIYTLKFFNRIEDIRELSTLINACGRLDHGDVALGFCLGSAKLKEFAEKIYLERKKHIVDGLNYIKTMNKISGKNYLILNCKDVVRDSVIGTLLTILSFSFEYPPETILVGMANKEVNKIKVSARITRSRKNSVNLRNILAKVCEKTGIQGECGGHPAAAGCLISTQDEENFINALKQELEYIQNEKN